MHELVLFGQVAEQHHHLLLQQLAGIARMQPVPTTERHLIFRAIAPSGRDRIQNVGGSQSVLPPDVQRTKTMLQGSLFHIQLVKDISEEISSHSATKDSVNQEPVPDGTANKKHSRSNPTPWTIEFRDIPDPSNHTITSRYVSRTNIESGDPLDFVYSLGHDYVSQYLLQGHKFYSDDTTITLHKILPLPHTQSPDLTTASLPDISSLHPLDPSGSYILQASVEMQIDAQNASGNQDLRNRATQQLLQLKDLLKQHVKLEPGERLSLDTRVNLRAAAAR